MQPVTSGHLQTSTEPHPVDAMNLPHEPADHGSQRNRPIQLELLQAMVGTNADALPSHNRCLVVKP